MVLRAAEEKEPVYHGKLMALLRMLGSRVPGPPAPHPTDEMDEMYTGPPPGLMAGDPVLQMPATAACRAWTVDGRGNGAAGPAPAVMALNAVDDAMGGKERDTQKVVMAGVSANCAAGAVEPRAATSDTMSAMMATMRPRHTKPAHAATQTRWEKCVCGALDGSPPVLLTPSPTDEGSGTSGAQHGAHASSSACATGAAEPGERSCSTGAAAVRGDATPETTDVAPEGETDTVTPSTEMVVRAGCAGGGVAGARARAGAADMVAPLLA